MDIIKYRRYVVSGAKDCIIHKPYRSTFLRELVRTGQGYYLSIDKVVVGYQVTNSTVSYKVFLPIFSSRRERVLSRINDEINKFAKFYVALFRMKLYIKEVDKISLKILRYSLPAVVLKMIGLYCYDPFLF